MADPLSEELERSIRSTGPLPFPTFMRLALYHPQHGYYTTRVPGHGADYRTSPSISPWFGRLIARELERMWQALGRPDPFWVVEAGPGLGDLAAEAIEGAAGLGGALRWRFIEQFERVQRWQRRRLGPAAEIADWDDALGRHRIDAGCVLANEVLDAFPVHVVQVGEGGRTEEVYVDVEDGRFAERLGPLSTPTLAARAAFAAAHLGPGDRFEICPGLDEWFRQASQAIKRGYLLVVDYGDEEPEIWLRTPGGSLAAPGPADLGSSPLEAPGRKDLTARVDFTAALESARAAGFEPHLPLPIQREWLRALGLDEIAEELDLARLHASLSGWVEDAVALEEELAGLQELTTEGELGDLLVLRASKQAPSPWDT